jgi:hypothetical protein
MDGTVRLQGFEATPYHAVCCTHCGYDLGYHHVNTTGMEQSIDHVTCPECFTKQYKTAANYAPDSWNETNAANSNMADRADESNTETYEILETVTGYRAYNFEFPEDLSWDDVRHHEIDWGVQQIRIRWTDATESRFDIGYGELCDELEDTGDVQIRTYDREIVY